MFTVHTGFPIVDAYAPDKCFEASEAHDQAKFFNPIVFTSPELFQTLTVSFIGS